MRPVRRYVVSFALLLLVACSSSATMSDSGGSSEGAAPEDGQAQGETVALGGDDKAAAEDRAADAAAEPPAVEELPEGPALPRSDRVIKEGTVSIEIGDGGFNDAFRAVIATAQKFGGDSVGSTTRTEDNGDVFGSVTVRVPVANFEDLLLGVGDIGTVVNRDVGSQDVSAEFTDLEARLRHMQAQERFYLGLFDKAETVQDAIAVQQQLDGIQSQIERTQGRLNFLDDRTSFSTLTVELFEPGAGSLVLDEEEPTDRPSLARYWDTARDAFVNVVGALLVAFFFLLPLLVPAAVVTALWIALRRSRPRPAPQAREPEDEREPVPADY